MGVSFTCKDLFTKKNITAKELEHLLHVRQEGACDFLLVDVRELFEFEEQSIQGTDVLLPFTRAHLYEETLERLSTTPFVLYCRTGSRTEHLLSVFKRMGFLYGTHLEKGIVSYKGALLKHATPPNSLK
jgi:rhodanese-related sulfurtransferase